MENCEWSYRNLDGYNYFKTACDKTAAFLHGAPHENGMKYCSFCGRPLTLAPGLPDPFPSLWDENNPNHPRGFPLTPAP